MQGLRLILRTDAPLDESARILLSVDELYRILAWANGASSTSGRMPNSQTWRGVPGLYIREGHSGSTWIDLFATLMNADSLFLAYPLAKAMNPLATLVANALDPKQRADARKTRAEAEGIEIANKLAEDMRALAVKDKELEQEAKRIENERNALALRKESDSERISDRNLPLQSSHPDLDRRDRVAIFPGHSEYYSQLTTEERVARLNEFGLDGPLVLQEVFMPAVLIYSPSRSIKAAEDAERKLEQIADLQDKTGAVEGTEPIDDVA